MVKPLKDQWIITNPFDGKTKWYTKHNAIDLRATSGTPIFAPVSGRITTHRNLQGGLWADLYGDNGVLFQFAHLKSVEALGRVSEGTVIALSGNSGLWTTAPHLHLQMKDSRGMFIDPAIYFKNVSFITSNNEMKTKPKLIEWRNALWVGHPDGRYAHIANEETARWLRYLTGQPIFMDGSVNIKTLKWTADITRFRGW